MKFRYFYKAAAIPFLFFCTAAKAQPNALGGWYYVNLNYHINQKFFVYGEVQTRSQQVLDDFYYRELKTGFGYALRHNMSALLGVGNYKTFTFPGNYEKPLRVNENRIWEQFGITNNLSRIFMEHRFRVEQRWLNGDYFNRFRYRLALSIPVNHPKIIDKTFFPVVFDEVFFSNKDPYFIRNRFMAGAGYRFSKSVTAQAGFIRQSDFSANGSSSGKNYIISSVTFNAGNNHKKPVSSSAD